MEEKPLHLSDLAAIDGAFISGTTVDVVPIGSIDDAKYCSASYPLIDRIIKEYSQEARAYIVQHKKN